MKRFLAAVLFAGLAAAGCRRAPLAFVSNERGGTVTVIDTARDRVVATIPVGERPRGIEASPDGGTIYVAVSSRSDPAGNSIVEIDARKKTIVRSLPSGPDPERVAVAPDGKTLWITNEDTAEASVMDLASGQLWRPFTSASGPKAGGQPDGKWCVTAEAGNKASVIDAERRAVVARSWIPAARRGVLTEQPFLITAEIGGTFSVVDTARRAVLGRDLRPSESPSASRCSEAAVPRRHEPWPRRGGHRSTAASSSRRSRCPGVLGPRRTPDGRSSTPPTARPITFRGRHADQQRDHLGSAGWALKKSPSPVTKREHDQGPQRFGSVGAGLAPARLGGVGRTLPRGHEAALRAGPD